MLAGSQSPHWICTSLRLTNIASPNACIEIRRLRYRSTATAARSLSTQLGFTRVGHFKLSKSDRSDFDRERVGVICARLSERVNSRIAFGACAAAQRDDDG